MKRRDALKTLGALAGAGAAARLLPACGDNLEVEPPSEPGAITNIVVMMLENRTYDHALGARKLLEGKPGDGLTAGMFNLDSGGNKVEIWQATKDKMCVLDPPHEWDASHRQFNAGANDGFLAEYQGHYAGETAVMQYLTREHQPASWALADHFASCDRWFASVMGPTWPNRMFWHSGQSNGLIDNVMPPGGFIWDTIYHRLDAKNVKWAYYWGNIPTLGIIPSDHLDLTGRSFRFTKFLADAKAGKLPPVVYIDPGFYVNDDHPPYHPILGQQLIATVYAALIDSPQWKNTLFVVTYDEHGGFFDHVAPPKAEDDRAADGFDQLGFRVPALVAGPYVKPGFVSSVVHDHTSVLKHIETMFGLDPLNKRTTAANDLSDFIDQDRLAAGDWTAPPDLPAVEVDQSMLGASCEMHMNATAGDHPVIDWWESQGKYTSREAIDWRKEGVAHVHDVAEFLAQRNAGGIRRGK